MKPEDQKNLNNLYFRYQSYDTAGTKYAYDIYYTTIHGGEQMKAKRDTGLNNFRRHIEELTERFEDVVSINVTDFTGKSKKCAMLNAPVEIRLLDVKNIENTPKVIVRNPGQSEQAPVPTGADFIQGLNGLFAGTAYEGLGGLAPYIKGIDDKHTIERLREKNDEQTRKIAELEQRNGEWQQKYDTLNGQYERLQDDTDDLEEELSEYRSREQKRDKWMSVVGMAGATIAKNFIRQNPGILAGIIPAEQLAGILADDEQPHPVETKNELSDEEQSRLDDATTVFEWLQTLDSETFEKVVSIISVIRQNIGYADHILAFLSGKNKSLVKS